MGTENDHDDTPLTDEAWRAETAAFKTPGQDGPAAADIDAEQTEGERNADGTFKAKDEPKAEAKAADAVESDEDRAAREEVEGKGGKDLPPGVQARIKRLNAKEDDLKRREAAVAAMEAEKAKPKDDAPKTDTSKITLPAHIEQADFEAAATFILENVDADTSDELKRVKGLTEDILVSMSDVADGDKTKLASIAEFVIASEPAIKAINELPARKRAAAFEKAFNAFAEAAPAKTEPEAKAKPDKSSKAPPPISRNGGATKSVNVDDFASYEAARNAEDIEKGQRPY